jgi:hypothetical protein
VAPGLAKELALCIHIWHGATPGTSAGRRTTADHVLLGQSSRAAVGGSVERVWRGQVYEREVGRTIGSMSRKPRQPWACGMSSRCTGPSGTDDWRRSSAVATSACWPRSGVPEGGGIAAGPEGSTTAEE